MTDEEILQRIARIDALVTPDATGRVASLRGLAAALVDSEAEVRRLRALVNEEPESRPITPEVQDKFGAVK